MSRGQALQGSGSPVGWGSGLRGEGLTWTAPPVWTWRSPGCCAPRVREACGPGARAASGCIWESGAGQGGGGQGWGQTEGWGMGRDRGRDRDGQKGRGRVRDDRGTEAGGVGGWAGRNRRTGRQRRRPRAIVSCEDPRSWAQEGNGPPSEPGGGPTGTGARRSGRLGAAGAGRAWGGLRTRGTAPRRGPALPAPALPAAPHLEHRVGEEGLQGALLAVGLGLVVLEQLVEVAVLLAVRQDLQAVLVVAHELLVDVQHGQQDVEQVRCKGAGLSGVGLRPPARPRPEGAPPPAGVPVLGSPGPAVLRCAMRWGGLRHPCLPPGPESGSQQNHTCRDTRPVWTRVSEGPGELVQRALRQPPPLQDADTWRGPHLGPSCREPLSAEGGCLQARSHPTA